MIQYASAMLFSGIIQGIILYLVLIVLWDIRYSYAYIWCGATIVLCIIGIIIFSFVDVKGHDIAVDMSVRLIIACGVVMLIHKFIAVK